MVDKTKASIGDTVFFEERWSHSIIKGEISEMHEEGARIDCEYAVNKNGQAVGNFPGTCGGKWEDLYTSAQEAYAGKEQKVHERAEKYKSEITDVASLIKFALEHPLCGEEYTDYAAIEAYKARSRELLGIDIEM